MIEYSFFDLCEGSFTIFVHFPLFIWKWTNIVEEPSHKLKNEYHSRTLKTQIAKITAKRHIVHLLFRILYQCHLLDIFYIYFFWGQDPNNKQSIYNFAHYWDTCPTFKNLSGASIQRKSNVIYTLLIIRILAPLFWG